MGMSWRVVYHPKASDEEKQLPAREREALQRAVEKLIALGPSLGYPYSSGVVSADRLRELRPRAGRSRWRALYRQIGDVFVIAAVGPEAQVNKHGFKRTIDAAERRLDEIKEGED